MAANIRRRVKRANTSQGLGGTEPVLSRSRSVTRDLVKFRVLRQNVEKVGHTFKKKCSRDIVLWNVLVKVRQMTYILKTKLFEALQRGRCCLGYVSSPLYRVLKSCVTSLGLAETATCVRLSSSVTSTLDWLWHGIKLC